MQPITDSPALIDQVYHRLLDAIADGSLVPGRALRQETLAAALGVSRQPVSHALRLLKQQGLLVEHGRKGLAVSPIEPGRVRDLYDVRATLDALAARRAAERVAGGLADRDLLRRLRQALAAGSALPTGGPVAAAIGADVTFHDALYRLSGNPAVLETVQPMWPHFKRSMGCVLSDPAMLSRVWQEHAAILAAVVAGDPAAAEMRARSHTLDAGTATTERIGSGLAA